MSELPIIARARAQVRALPPLLVDGALAALALVAQIWPLLNGDWHWWGYAVVTASAAPLIVRRHAPFAVLLASMTATALYDSGGRVADQPIWYGGLIALYTVAAYSTRTSRLIALTGTVVGGIVSVGSSETALRGTLVFTAAYAIGRAAAASRAYAKALEERAEHLEHEKVREAERAAERERASIARDMHDILAHAVSIMVVQAEAGPLVMRKSPEKAEAAFDAIAGAGRDAMLQLRRILGVLDSDRAPQPTLDDLPGLVRDLPGLAVSYRVEGDPKPISADCAVAAYRVTQEALTNIVKHSGARNADIRLRWKDENLMIDITDDGQGTGRGLPSGGHGLIGIRERAAACGGTASAGPRPDAQGFAVSVSLPLVTA